MTSTDFETLRITGGSIAVTRLYDVAYAIDLEQVARTAPAHPTRLRLARARARSIAYSEPPVDLDLGSTRLAIGTSELEVAIRARVFDFGAIRLSYTFDAAEGPWSSFVALVDELERLSESADPWRSDLQRVLDLVGSALSRRTDSGIEIDHTFVTLRGFHPHLASEDVLERVDLVPVLTGEHEPLSRRARGELLSRALTYYEDDLVVIGPTRSFIVEPEGEPDVADVVGMAHAQLLELRYYDQLLARELIAMHERIQGTRARVGPLARRRYAELARSLYALHAEITSVSERIDNALVVTEDVYLARVYDAALEQHRVPSWSAGVHRSLELVRDAYTALNDEATSARAEYLEIAIVLLIAVDIVLVLLG
jgi:hypothetical protein